MDSYAKGDDNERFHKNYLLFFSILLTHNKKNAGIKIG